MHYYAISSNKHSFYRSKTFVMFFFVSQRQRFVRTIWSTAYRRVFTAFNRAVRDELKLSLLLFTQLLSSDEKRVILFHFTQICRRFSSDRTVTEQQKRQLSGQNIDTSAVSYVSVNRMVIFDHTVDSKEASIIAEWWSVGTYAWLE